MWKCRTAAGYAALVAAPLRILSIDGGGIRGIIPAIVLDHIEERTERRIADLFDVIAGTSTGGLLALALAVPGDGGRPRYAAADVVEIYADNGAGIFPEDWFGKIRQLVNEKYPATGLERVLDEQLGRTRLRDALTDVIVTAYDIERRSPFFFRSARAREEEGYDFAMRDVARATSAAPTYFEPVQLPAAPPHSPYTLVDGGVFANNPGMCAFVDRWAGQGNVEDTLMVSLGTGVLTRPIAYEDAKDWGLIEWARPVIDVVFDGVSDAVDYQLKAILGKSYYRFQTTLDKAEDAMDDASRRNIDNLKLEGEDLIATEGDELEEVCERLLAST